MTKVAFTDVKWTMLVTLHMRAMDSRQAEPVLGDRFAAEAERRVDYDFGSWRMRVTEGDRHLVVLRAKRLDTWAARFLAAHPDAVVAHLGCGLDSRWLRLAPPPTVSWFDVDLPEVMALRRQLYGDAEGYRMIASSVTDPRWVDHLPTGRPLLVIAEGLLMYLTAPHVAGLLTRLTARAPAGQVLFDAVSPWVVPATAMLSPLLGAFRMRWALSDVREVRRWGLRHLDTETLLGHHERVPSPLVRSVYTVFSHVPPVRDALRAFRFEF
ncbi:class I SAM-dependent methyltransferase [Actinokineospora pegani]|uniref:class I SAM-dependent methyltransferase n=1 Tax=Actinokineospora pegani TaxID=2654637 RepID=UPI0012EA8B2C|nr:class I SAM-dependent methyltransferase [Actinokineospora pegani]